MQADGERASTISHGAASATRLSSTSTGGAAGLAKRPHRGHYAAPYVRQCEDAGCHVEVSWALEEHPDKTDRRAAEERLIQLHREVMGVDPPIQHGGRGVAAYLEKRRASRA